MKKLLIAALAAASLAAAYLAVPFVPGAPVPDAQANPDCPAVDHHRDGYVDIFDIVAVVSLPGGEGRAKILVNNFGEAC